MGRTECYSKMNRLSLRNNWLKFKTSEKSPIIFEESIEYTLIHLENQKMSMCKQLDLQTPGSHLIMAKNLPGH